MDVLIQAAMAYRRYGLSIVPVTRHKNPIGNWREFQRRIMTEQEIIESFTKGGVRGIAVVCGAGSGFFEGLDIDSRNDLSGTLMYEYVMALRDSDSSLYDRLVAATTKNKGYHFYYRCETVERDKVLARRPASPEEQIVRPKTKAKVLIETRSNGGIIVVPPTQGYRFLQHDLGSTPLIVPADRRLLFDIAGAFNQVRLPPPESSKPVRIYTEEESPFFEYDLLADEWTMKVLLEKHDWIFVETVFPRSFYLRPGRTDQRTSGNFHHEMKLFKVFSSNSDFEEKKPYRPHAVFAILECGGNFKVAAKRLVDLGFGKPYKRA